MKRVMKWALIAVGALFVIGLIGSLMTPEGREGMERAADDVTSRGDTRSASAATPEPTAAPASVTAEPTVAPTPEPTPVPTINGGAVAAIAFGEHVTPVIDDIVADLEAITAGAGDGDISAVTDAAIDLWIDAGNEVAWLEANPPDACFAEAHSTWLDAMREYEEAGDLISDGWILSDMSLVEEGMEAMDRGTEAVNRASAAVSNIAANCG